MINIILHEVESSKDYKVRVKSVPQKGESITLKIDDKRAFCNVSHVLHDYLEDSIIIHVEIDSYY